MQERLKAAPHESAFSTGHLQKNIGMRAVSGGIVTGLSQGIRLLFYLAMIAIMARMLAPPDFGLVAMVAPLVSLLRLLRESGLSVATIQRDSITHAQVSNLFWINVALGILTTLVGIACAPLLAWFFRDQRLVGVTVFLSLSFIIGSLCVQHVALLNREMRFKAIGAINIISVASGLVTAVVMASLGFGYWSLVGSQLAAALTETVFAWGLSGWRPQWLKARSGTRSMLHFGASLTFSTVARRLATSADTLLIGRYYDAAALGVYSRAGVLIMGPLDQLLQPFDAVVLPLLSRLRQEPERYKKTFLQILNGMALVCFPAAGVLVGLSTPLVLLLLGSRWIEVAPLFALSSAAVISYPMVFASTLLLTTQGRNRDIIVSGLVVSLTTVAMVLIGLPFGLTAVAFFAAFGGLLLRLPIQYYIVGKSGPVGRADLFRVVLNHLHLWVAAGLAAYLPQVVFPQAHFMVQAIVGGFLGVATAALLVRIVPSHWREVRTCVDIVKQTLTKRASV